MGNMFIYEKQLSPDRSPKTTSLLFTISEDSLLVLHEVAMIEPMPVVLVTVANPTGLIKFLRFTFFISLNIYNYLAVFKL
jgi:hypothetical protein